MHLCIEIKQYKMFNAISWSMLMPILFVLTGGYYAFVFLIFYRKDGLMLIRSRLHRGVLPIKRTQYTSEPEMFEFRELLEDLKALFEKAAKTEMIKEELLQALKSEAKGYSGLMDKKFMEDLSEHIRIEARDNCGIELNERELRGIW